MNGTLGRSLAFIALASSISAAAESIHVAALARGFKPVRTERSVLGKKRFLKSKTDYAALTRSGVLEEAVARKFAEDKLFLVESLFKEQPSPYPGPLSYKIGCPKEFQPERAETARNGRWTVALKLRANDRFVSGGCTEDSNSYARYLVFVYCPTSRRLVELDYFTPLRSPTLTLEALVAGCECGE